MIVLNIPWLCYSPLSASTVVAASITRDRKRTFDTRKIQPRKGDMFVRRSGQISNSLFFSLSLSLFFSPSPIFRYRLASENLIATTMKISTCATVSITSTNSITFLLVLAKLLTNRHRGFVI